MTADEVVVDAIVLADLVQPFGAMVVMSTLPHVTVVHQPEQAAMIDKAIVDAGLRGERIGPTRVKVFPR